MFGHKIPSHQHSGVVEPLLLCRATSDATSDRNLVKLNFSHVGEQERGYMKKEGRALKPESRGRVLTEFLQAYFPRYVDYGFTASLEDELDEVSGEFNCLKTVYVASWHP